MPPMVTDTGHITCERRYSAFIYGQGDRFRLIVCQHTILGRGSLCNTEKLNDTYLHVHV